MLAYRSESSSGVTTASPQPRKPLNREQLTTRVAKPRSPSPWVHQQRTSVHQFGEGALQTIHPVHTQSMFSPDVLERRQRLVHRWLRTRGIHLTQKHAILLVIGILGLYNLTILQRLPAKVACPPLSLRRIGRSCWWEVGARERHRGQWMNQEWAVPKGLSGRWACAGASPA